MKLKLPVTLFLIFSLSIFSQEKYKRIIVQNPSQSTLNEIMKLGVDLRCGAHFHDQGMQLELSNQEIENLDKAGIGYTVLVEDLTTYYAKRATENLPLAKMQLALEKGKKDKNAASKAVSSIESVILDNYLQYYGEAEVDWTVPSNFVLGSMGGCLTVQETLNQLDAMRTYSVNNGLNIITVKTDASPTNQTTYGFAGTGGWSGQTVYYVKISDNADGADDSNEPDILYTSMIHSRELSSLMGNIYFMWYLLENYATNSAVKHLVDNNELFFVPIVNPDGLRWNEKENPNGGGMNRTNLRGFSTGDPTNNSNYIENYGVDPNRNFNYLWGSAGLASGSSGDYRLSTYRGPSAFSEPESQIMRDFILARNFKTAVWQHSYANGIPHPYGGIPTKVSGREDEMAKWHEDMTRYNRYVYGAQVLSPANGIADDWMLGGTVDSNGSVGSGMNILATTPENGADNGSEGGFWPSPTDVVPIAKRMMRINLMNAYYGGKYAKFHDLSQSEIISTSPNLTFGIERVGQTASDYTITVTPISANILSAGSPITETGMAVLEQRNISIQLNLNPSITSNEKIEYSVSLSNDDGVIYEANFVKYYQPSILFSDNPDTDTSITNWVESANWINSTVSAWSGTRSLKAGLAIPYANSIDNTLTTTNSYNFSGANEIVVQFFAKWDLERNFDFVEILGSADNGSNWVRLNGKYNKPEASSFTNGARSSYSNEKNLYLDDQAASSGLVYDGNQMDNWVMEEIVIDDVNNSSLLNATNAKFRFRFVTDGNNIGEVNYSTTYEGFYFDDFKIIKIQEPCVLSVPVNVAVSGINTDAAVISWDAVTSATYDLQYRVVGATTWIDVVDLVSNTYNLTGLAASTQYEVRVRAKCELSESNYSNIIQFTTSIPNYCSSSGDTTDKGIVNVTFTGETTINNSDTVNNNSGYEDFTNQTADVYLGQRYSLSVSINTGNGNNTLYTRVFIDFNRNGDFNDAGESFDLGTVNKSANALTSSSPLNIDIPSLLAGGQTGITRMRIASKQGSYPTSCESFSNGEVEDYTLNIIDASLGIQDEILRAFNLYPNPVSNGKISITVPNEIDVFTITVSGITGQQLFTTTLQNNAEIAHQITVPNLKTGIYFVTVSTNLGKASKKLIVQ